MAEGKSRLGEYELIAKLGEGGMGAVYKARQLSLDRLVALKILHRRLAADQDFLQRFIREARATAKLNHGNIVAGIDVNCVDGYYYFAMEYVEGSTLGARIRGGGPLPEDEVLRIGAAMASALAHAHQAGIVHRDVKPDNILIDTRGTPKLADLGLAKGTAQTDNSVTQAGFAIGTPHYMSPEQVRGENVDGRTDTYSLGCTLYHAATGRTPYTNDVTPVLMTKHLNEKIPHPQSIRPELSEGFCNILARMVARDAADRYQDLAQAGEDMQAQAAGKASCPPLPAAKSNFLSVTARAGTAKGLKPGGRQTSRNAPVGTGTRKATPIVEDQPPPESSKKKLIVIGGAVAAALVAIVVVALLGSGPPAPRVTEKVPPKEPSKTSTPDTPPPPVPPVPATPSPEQLAAKAWDQLEKFEGLTPEDTAGRVARVQVFLKEHGGTVVAARARVLLQKLTAPPDPPDPPARPLDALADTAATSLMPGADLAGWKVMAPQWSLEDGALRAVSGNRNACLARYRVLPRDFELTMTVTAPGRFHLCWSGGTREAPVLTNLHKERDGQLHVTRVTGPVENDVCEAAEKVAGDTHSFRVAVSRGQAKVFVDGALALTAPDPPALLDKRDLYLFGGAEVKTDFRELACRDLNAPPRPPGTWQGLFKDASLDGWEVVNPEWRPADGGATGNAALQNALLRRAKALPREFELRFEAESSTDFCVEWTALQGKKTYGLHRNRLRQARLLLRNDEAADQPTEELASAETPDGRHSYRLVVLKNRIEVHVDNAQRLKHETEVPWDGQNRDLRLVSALEGQTTFSKVAARELPLPEVPVAVAAPPAGGALFAANSLDGWEVVRPEWTPIDGGAVGKADTNVATLRRKLATSEFELAFEAETTRGFHVSWETKSARGDAVACILFHTPAGNLRLAFNGPLGGQPPEPASGPGPGKHAYRILAAKDGVQVFVDGALKLSAAREFGVDAAKRDLTLFSAGGGETRYTKMTYRELSAPAPTQKPEEPVATTPAVPTGPDPLERIPQLLQPNEQSAALATYGAFVSEYLGVLRKLDRKAALARLDELEKNPVMKGLAPNLKDCRRLADWLDDLARVEIDGAKKLKDVDDFELVLTVGKPLHVGKRVELQLTDVRDGKLELSSAAGMGLSRPLALLAPETRLKLSEMGLPQDAKGLTRRAFAASLALRTPPDPRSMATVLGLLKKATDANAPEDETAVLKSWLNSIEESTDLAAAGAAWARLLPAALGRKWKALHEDLVRFVTNYGKTAFFTAKQADIDALTKLVKEQVDQENATPDQQTKTLIDRLRAANPNFAEEVRPRFSDNKMTDLYLIADHLTDLSPLRSLTSLKTLSCNAVGETGSRLSDLRPLQGLQLTSFECMRTSVSDLTPLKDMPLKRLNVNDTKVTDLSPLKSMPLDYLSVSGCRIADLAALKGVPLKLLFCQNCQLADLSPLKGMALTTLSCGSNPIASLEPLAELPLLTLRIQDIKATDLSALKDLRLLVLTLDYKAEHAALLRGIPTLRLINNMEARAFLEQNK